MLKIPHKTGKRKIKTNKIKHPETNLPFLAWLKKEDKTCY